MKSLLPIDETWTIKTFGTAVTTAASILEHNKLPDTSANAKPFGTLLEQQRNRMKNIVDGVASTIKQADETMDSARGRVRKSAGPLIDHINDIKANLSDDIKSVAISVMSDDDYSDYKITGILPGLLCIPGKLIDTVTPVAKALQTEILDIVVPTETYNPEHLDPIEIMHEQRKALDHIHHLIRDEIPTIEVPSVQSASNSYVDSGFWKNRGEVMIQIEGAEAMPIPAWPEEISDRIAVSWSQEMTTYQHYEDQNTFKQSGPRTMDLLFKLHRAMWNGNQDSGDCETLIAYIESACYPDYDTQASEPPRVLFTAGKSVRIYGIITGMSVKYCGPIGPDVKYDRVEISLSIKEESQNVLSTQVVRAGLAGWR